MTAATDPELRAILEHNGNEEKEHAAMVLEWLRRQDAGFDRHLRTYLFSEGSITAAEGNEKSAAASSSKPVAGSGKSLGIGSLKVK